MPILFDVYVLAPERSASAAMQFLDRFLPQRRALFSESGLHEDLGLPTPVTFSEALQHLETNKHAEADFYWSHPTRGVPHFAILSFSRDGCMILGLSPCGEDDAPSAVSALRQLQTFACANHGYIGVEEPPASSRDEFLERVSGWAPEV